MKERVKPYKLTLSEMV